MAIDNLIPRKVPPIETKYRRIATEIPVPESIPILEKLRRTDPNNLTPLQAINLLQEIKQELEKR